MNASEQQQHRRRTDELRADVNAIADALERLMESSTARFDDLVKRIAELSKRIDDEQAHRIGDFAENGRSIDALDLVVAQFKQRTFRERWRWLLKGY